MNEKKLAQSLLDCRNKGIRPGRAVLPRTPLSIIAALICVGLGVFSFSTECGKESFALIWLLIGVMVGKHLRDFAWSRDIKKTFPTMRRFIDWTKVEAAAKGEDSSTTKSTLSSEGVPSDDKVIYTLSRPQTVGLTEWRIKDTALSVRLRRPNNADRADCVGQKTITASSATCELY